jgi:hypothetical protein
MEALQRLHNRGSIGGYDIDNSLKFEADNTEYLTRTPSSSGNEKTWTWSGWVKYTEPTLSPQTVFAGGTDSGSYGALNFRIDAGQLELNTASIGLRTATQKFRDPSAWYHFVVAMDTTQSTANDRIKIYVNGSQITDFSVINNPPQNTDMGVNANELQTISRRSNANDRYFAGYMAELHLIDGTALTPISFGEYDNISGIWKPKTYDGSYGTNGYYLKFDDSASLGADSSGNSNDFTLNNITSADQATDTPTNNFATWQALTGQPYPVIRNGATHYNLSGQVGWYSNVGSIAFTKGKWYAEFRLGSGITNMMAGVSQVESEQSWNNTHLGGVANSTAYTMGFYNANGNVYTNNGSTAWGSSFPAGTIIMVAVDYKTSGVVSLYFGTNGTWANSSNPETGANNFDMNSGSPLPNNLAISFAASPYNNGGNAEANFGGFSGFSIASGNSDENGYGNFEYAPPSGYYALCTKNLAEYG